MQVVADARVGGDVHPSGYDDSHDAVGGTVKYRFAMGVIATLLIGSGCGSTTPSNEASSSATTITESAPAPATTTAPAATTAPATTTAAAAAASCDPEAFLPLLQSTLDDPAAELRIVEVQVKLCRSGYAQVFAVPDQSVCEPGVGHCYDSEQVFLQDVAGEWQIEASGTGIGCDDGSVPADVCEGLGSTG